MIVKLFRVLIALTLAIGSVLIVIGELIFALVLGTVLTLINITSAIYIKIWGKRDE